MHSFNYILATGPPPQTNAVGYTCTSVYLTICQNH